jgi:hypothetical protein
MGTKQYYTEAIQTKSPEKEECSPSYVDYATSSVVYDVVKSVMEDLTLDDFVEMTPKLPST